MNCAPFDLRDYFFAELKSAEAKQVELHLAACKACQVELSQLDVTRVALMQLPQEEPPRRIAFVSDKVFAPTMWQRFWQSGAKLGFASAAMVTAGLLVNALTRPSPVVQYSNVNYGAIEAKVREEVSRQIPVEVAKAVSVAEEKNLAQVHTAVASVEKKYAQERELDIAVMRANFDILQSRMSQRYLNLASYDGGVK